MLISSFACSVKGRVIVEHVYHVSGKNVCYADFLLFQHFPQTCNVSLFSRYDDMDKEEYPVLVILHSVYPDEK